MVTPEAGSKRERDIGGIAMQQRMCPRCGDPMDSEEIAEGNNQYGGLLDGVYSECGLCGYWSNRVGCSYHQGDVEFRELDFEMEV